MTDTGSGPVAKEAVVLVAEDQPLARAYILDVLLDANFAALETSCADEALALLQTRDDIDALLTDIEMPGKMNGLSLAEIARRSWPHLAIVIMSGNPLPSGHVLPARSCFHPKPCDIAALLSQLRNLIAVSRPLRSKLN